jgi:methionyl-tRNA formyltransferase
MQNQKILMISDNPYLCNEVQKIIEKKQYINKVLDFAMSPFTKSILFNKIIPQTLDLKNPQDVDFIINNYHLVISLHCKQIFPSKLVKAVRCVNIHPGYNPINRGWYPQIFSIIHNLPIGATIHEIDEDLDHGNIIVRAFVKKEKKDTSLTLYNKIINKEIELLETHLDSILDGSYDSIKPENEGNLFLKKDFNKLCRLNLNEVSTLDKFIDKLRALTHGDHNNCYYVNEETGKKVFIKIQLNEES